MGNKLKIDLKIMEMTLKGKKNSVFTFTLIYVNYLTQKVFFFIVRMSLILLFYEGRKVNDTLKAFMRPTLTVIKLPGDLKGKFLFCEYNYINVKFKKAFKQAL